MVLRAGFASTRHVVPAQRGQRMKTGFLGIVTGLLALYALQPAGVALVVLGALYVAFRTE